mmetsp:Transcript_62095/g.170597  ORF Transcript_62095/g.170597 Transcript_62095/m.170597 type:complete len:257 (+) Transcript_62095:193-963(+)
MHGRRRRGGRPWHGAAVVGQLLPPRRLCCLGHYLQQWARGQHVVPRAGRDCVRAVPRGCDRADGGGAQPAGGAGARGQHVPRRRRDAQGVRRPDARRGRLQLDRACLVGQGQGRVGRGEAPRCHRRFQRRQPLAEARAVHDADQVWHLSVGLPNGGDRQDLLGWHGPGDPWRRGGGPGHQHQGGAGGRVWPRLPARPRDCGRPLIPGITQLYGHRRQRHVGDQLCGCPHRVPHPPRRSCTIPLRRRLGQGDRDGLR